MKRRTFIATSLAATAIVPSAFAMDAPMLNYTDGLVRELLTEGKTVFIDYATDWCSTCASQERTIAKLRADNADYDANITFVRVDYDQYSNSAISVMNNIPRRSTLIVLKGDAELGRIVAGTSTKDIKALLDTALTAATS